jgi:Flp pilus assembly protein TadG
MRYAWTATVLEKMAVFRRAATALPGDRRGVSAIEFVLVFPILIGLLAGTVDFGQALMVSRKMNQIVGTVGDMVSQKSAWTSTDVEAIITGSAVIIQPYSANNLVIHMAIVDVASDLTTKVNWAKAYNGTPLAANAASPVDIPANIAEADVQMIVVKATYQLTTPFSSLLQPITGVTSYSYNKTYIMRPRVKDTIALD